MICLPCREAGILNREGFFFSAQQGHERCVNPATCACQHQTGAGHLNTERAA